MFFIHEKTFYVRGVQRTVPAPFAAVNLRYAPVRGGRWGVRKMRYGQRLWRAYTSGIARSLSMNFYTHAEAMRWADIMATLIKSDDIEMAHEFRNAERRKQRVEDGLRAFVIKERKKEGKK